MDLTAYFPLLKSIHITTVVITGSLFILRFVWMSQGTLHLRGRWVETVPHVNDTLLFISGLMTASVIGELPLQAPWLTTKLFILLAYIVLGSIALKRGRSTKIRLWSGYAAILCYLTIIAIALTRSPLPNFSQLRQALGF
jgi:uncharacterized membrane protein SirB2